MTSWFSPEHFADKLLPLAKSLEQVSCNAKFPSLTISVSFPLIQSDVARFSSPES